LSYPTHSLSMCPLFHGGNMENLRQNHSLEVVREFSERLVYTTLNSVLYELSRDASNVFYMSVHTS